MTRPHSQLFLDRSLDNFSLIKALSQITLGTIVNYHDNRYIIDPNPLVAADLLSKDSL